MKILGLALVTVFFSLGQVRAEDEAQPLKAALAQCFNLRAGSIPSASDPKTIPAGLIHGRDVSVVPLAGMGGRAFSYEGREAHVISCGIAIYGPISDSLQKEISTLIEKDARWIASSPNAYKHAYASGTEKYWGDPHAPSMNGVLLVMRHPSPNAPTLEVEYHTVLAP